MTKTIFITGGSRGIGEAIVRECAGKYNVAFTYNHSIERAKTIESELAHLGVLAIECDVTSPQSVENAVAIAKKRFGKIDILVNNAGVSKSGMLIDISLDEWNNLFNVNVNGVFNVTKAVLNDMLSRHSGVIVNVSSIWGEQGASMECAYSATKSAVIGFSKALAKELAPNGIRVNAICPGAIDTDMMKCYSQDEIDALCEEIPLGRLGKPSEVAKAVMFLIENEYITATTLTVSGGF